MRQDYKEMTLELFDILHNNPNAHPDFKKFASNLSDKQKESDEEMFEPVEAVS